VTFAVSLKSGLYIKDTGSKGRGVFCREFIKAGEIIETAPCLLCSEKEMEYIQNTDLVNYVFNGENSFSRNVYVWANINQGEQVTCLVMGITSF